MELVEVFVALSVLVAGLAGGWLLARRLVPPVEPPPESDLSGVLNDLLLRLKEDQRENVDTLRDHLTVGQQVMGRERDRVVDQVSHVQNELRRVAHLVDSLRQEKSQQQGQLLQAIEVTSQLHQTTESLQQALAAPKARGQWGERMAEDVLSAAGFVEGINYQKQTKAAGGGLPDFTFNLPNGHLVHMDVKFPIDNYLRWLEAEPNDLDRYAKAFRRDVHQRVKELGARDYVHAETTVDFVLLFVPNESVFGFMHEHDPGLIDAALQRKVVLCSPTTLFAVLAVIRQAVTNFLVERQSHEILAAVNGLRGEWDKLRDPMAKMGRGLDSAQKAYEDLVGPRSRQFERQLEKLEQHRDLDGEAGDQPALGIVKSA